MDSCRIVTGNEKKSPEWSRRVLDLDQLKFRERDDLEFTLKFWRDDKKSFQMDKMRYTTSGIVAVSPSREYRLRAYYGICYDHRDNLSDWDYQMKLHEKV